MAVCYKRLIDLDLKKKDLEEKAGISHYTVNKLTKSENVTTDILEKICIALNCPIEEILEVIPDKDEKTIIKEEC